MAQLIVRDIAEDCVHELELRAARNGRSVEEEHREILRRALGQPSGSSPRRSLKQLISEMPEGIEDRDSDIDRTRP